MKLSIFLFCICFISTASCIAQKDDSVMVGKIYTEAIRTNAAYKNLDKLCELYPGRMVGSASLFGAIDYTRNLMISIGADSVYLQPFDGPQWKPGDKSIASIHSDKMGNKTVHILPLGLSIGTDDKPLTARIVEVMNFAEFEKLGKENIAGKIVFFNRPFPKTTSAGMSGYGMTVDQRTQGASQAARFGAIGVLVRSVTPSIDTFPHTGVMQYKEGIDKIPAVAISTVDADILSDWLKSDPNTACTFQTGCQFLSPAKVYNVVGEIRGTDKPNEFITVGGHLDCWYDAAGAQDDGAGCVQSIDVLRIFRKLNIKPRHTIRIVMFVDEEMTQSGARKYAELAAANNEKHIAGMESDAGGFKPNGIGITASDELFTRFLSWQNYFKPFGITGFKKGGGGADVGPLAKLGAITCSFIPEPNNYFDYHHSGRDNIKAVDPTELELGSACMAAFIYLLDSKGF
jgi:carboxypeptidase Q